MAKMGCNMAKQVPNFLSWSFWLGKFQKPSSNCHQIWEVWELFGAWCQKRSRRSAMVMTSVEVPRPVNVGLRLQAAGERSGWRKSKVLWNSNFMLIRSPKIQCHTHHFPFSFIFRPKKWWNQPLPSVPKLLGHSMNVSRFLALLSLEVCQVSMHVTHQLPQQLLDGWTNDGSTEQKNTILLLFFPECVARVPVSFGGLGVRLCSRKVVSMFATVRNRSQPFASDRNRLREGRKALHSGECTWSDPESVWSWVMSPQLYWCLQRRCLCERSVSPQLYWCLQRRCLCECSVAPQLYWCLQERCLCEWSVAPQLYWCLQKRCQCEWSVSPQLYWFLQRRCLCEWSVSPQLYWCLQPRCLCEWSVSPQCRRSYIGVCSGGVCVSALWRRSYIGVCRRGVCVSDLWRRSYIGVCRRGVSASDLCRRSYIGFCRGGVCVSDLCRRSYIGVCSRGVCVSDLCHRSYIDLCSGVTAVILAFAAEVSVWVICGVAVILVSAEDVSERVACGAAAIVVFAEEVFVWGICGAAVLLAFAEEVSVRVICGVAVILAFAAEVSVWGICGVGC